MSIDPAPIYAMIREVPAGSVASYGMIASLLPGYTARMVGRALSNLEDGSDVPWHRIVQSAGTIAPRLSAGLQFERLRTEGIAFRKNGNVDWSSCRWKGPSNKWIRRNNADPITIMEIVAAWRS